MVSITSVNVEGSATKHMCLLKCTAPNAEDWWVALLHSILEIPGSDLGQENGHSDRLLRGCIHFLRASHGEVTQIWPRRLPFIPIPIHCSLLILPMNADIWTTDSGVK
jgi:hypothetical protein